MQSRACIAYATSNGKTAISMWVMALGSATHALTAYLLLAVLNLGFDGIALATSLHYLTRFLVSSAYINFHFPKSHGASLFTLESTQHLGN